MRMVAYFDSVQAIERASREASRTGWRTVSVCSPAFDQRLIDIARATRSPVAICALIGGIVGLVSGLLLTIWTVRQWPGLIVGGKPLVSVPPFLIIMFEVTILVAAIAAVCSFLILSARARRTSQGVCDRTTTDNRFSLLLESIDTRTEIADEGWQQLGAREWRRV